MTYANCQSCGMPINTGHFCNYCADAAGNLHGFDETVTRMAQFWRSQDPTLTEEAAKKKTLDYMSTMPAWKNHPKLS
jgi:hypothetical protein